MFHQLQTDIRDTRQLVASHIVVDGDVERVAITQIQFLDFSRNRSRCDTHPADRLSLLVEDMNRTVSGSTLPTGKSRNRLSN